MIHKRAPRSLHLIDIENLCGSGHADADLIRTVFWTYRFGVPSTKDDQWVVGSSKAFAARAWFVLPRQGIVRRARSGRDGGELSIITELELDLDHVARRFDRLVIASGDGMFTPVARGARTRGLHVHQVSGFGLCSRALAAAAQTRSRLRLDDLLKTAA